MNNIEMTNPLYKDHIRSTPGRQDRLFAKRIKPKWSVTTPLVKKLG